MTSVTDLKAYNQSILAFLVLSKYIFMEIEHYVCSPGLAENQKGIRFISHLQQAE